MNTINITTGNIGKSILRIGIESELSKENFISDDIENSFGEEVNYFEADKERIKKLLANKEGAKRSLSWIALMFFLLFISCKGKVEETQKLEPKQEMEEVNFVISYPDSSSVFVNDKVSLLSEKYMLSGDYEFYEDYISGNENQWDSFKGEGEYLNYLINIHMVFFSKILKIYYYNIDTPDTYKGSFQIVKKMKFNTDYLGFEVYEVELKRGNMFDTQYKFMRKELGDTFCLVLTFDEGATESYLYTKRYRTNPILMIYQDDFHPKDGQISLRKDIYDSIKKRN
jgi:hypothetical protein